MTTQEAIHVLMLSPIYFKLSPADRWQLIQEYCLLFLQVCNRQEEQKNASSPAPQEDPSTTP